MSIEADRRPASDEERGPGAQLDLPADASSENDSFPEQDTLSEHDTIAACPTPLEHLLGTLPAGAVWLHLKIVRFLRRGSFGDVYLAWDSRLERQVALKLLRSGGASALAEARVMSRIRHPNVVTVHGADQSAGHVGIWMDFIEGETLFELVSVRGRLGVHEAAALGIELARALGAVHAAGHVHRDIKPQNVMREKNGRIVVMDFGLSQALSSQTGIELAGTLAYMAPELVEGAAATPSSDVYAAGILLFFLVSGSLPSSARTLEEFRACHRQGERRRLGDLRPDVSRTYLEAIDRATAPNPAERLRSAGALQAALLAVFQEPSPVWLSRRRIFKLAAGPLAATVAWAGWQFWREGAGAALASGSSMLVVDTENSTPDSELTAIAELFRTQLSQSAHLRVLERDRVRETLERMGHAQQAPLTDIAAREVALRTGASSVLFSTLARLGGRYVLNVRLEQVGTSPQTPGPSWEQTESAGGKAALFDAVRAASLWVRQKTGESQRALSAHDSLPQDTTTASWEALKLFADAQHLAEARYTEDAVLMLRHALNIDPEFALARMRLADLLISLNRQEEGFREWRAAIDKAGGRRLTEREQYRIRGGFAQDSEDFVVAESVYRDYERVYANDPLPHFYLGNVLHRSGRSEEAIPELRQAGRLNPDSYVPPANLAMVFLTLGWRDQVEQELERVRKLGQPEIATLYKALADLLAGAYPRAREALTALSRSASAEVRSRTASALANLLAETGQLEASRDLLQAHAAEEQRKGNSGRAAAKLAGAAYLEWRLLRPHQAAAMCYAALDLDTSAEIALKAGTVLARCGLPEAAQKLADGRGLQLDLARFRVIRARLGGEAQFARGQVEAAARELEAADRMETRWHPREYLARALERAGRVDAALARYRQLADGHAWFLQAADHEYPGLWVDTLGRYWRAAERAGRDLDVAYARSRYEAARGLPALAPELL